MRALILAGGGLTVTPLLRILSEAELIIAADGGLKHARTLGLCPDLIVGDLDSAQPDDLERFASVEILRYPEDKNYLDLELALQAAFDRGATELRLFGVLGSRLDQSLAALFIATRLKSAGVELSLHGATQDVFLLRGDDQLELDLPKGQLFSLLSLTAQSRVSAANALYALENLGLLYGVGLGVSNRVLKAPLRLRVAEGLVALVLERGDDV